MDWADSFYSQTGKWWGPAEYKITKRDYQRLETVKRLYGKLPIDLLELGSSYGNTAAVFADVGINVTAIELSDRIDFAKQYEGLSYKGKLQFIKDDFYQVNLSKKFDVVCYWNGFGIGSDNDQRKLLKRIANEWLKEKGSLVMDVQNPYVWAKWHGDREEKMANPSLGYNFDVSQKIQYDPVSNIAYDSWWETNKPEKKHVQTLRCYAPCDLQLLLENTGLRLKHIEANGEKVEIETLPSEKNAFWDASEYLVQLDKI